MIIESVIDVVLADDSASCWLKNSLLAALARDPVDAALDASFLHDLLDARAARLLAVRIAAVAPVCRSCGGNHG